MKRRSTFTLQDFKLLTTDIKLLFTEEIYFDDCNEENNNETTVNSGLKYNKGIRL